MDGLESIHRIACGECHEFKLIVTLHESDFAIWECDSFTFESDVLKQMEAIEGATKVETQTYTFTDLTKEENKEEEENKENKEEEKKEKTEKKQEKEQEVGTMW